MVSGMEEITFVGIPFYTLAEYRGMAAAVKTLRAAGIVQRLGNSRKHVNDIGDVECPTIKTDKGPANLKNFDSFLEGTLRVKDKLSRQASGTTLTFCQGGDCAFVIGSIAGLTTIYKGKPGMVWLDAHGDYNTPETTPSGFIGGMPLAIACGLGPKLPPGLEKQRPMLDPHNVVHVGSRSLDPGEEQNLRSQTTVYDAKTVKKQTMKQIARQTAKQLVDTSDWIIAHLDVDVLDPTIIPGVNFPEPQGLNQNDITTIFHELQNTGKLRVVDLTAYNPTRDPDNRARTVLLELAPKLVGK